MADMSILSPWKEVSNLITPKNTSADVGTSGSNKEIRLYEGSNYVGFEAPALSADQIWALPTADGSANQALSTDGSGTLGFMTVGVANSWRDPVEDKDLTTAPGAPDTGDRYIIAGTGGGWSGGTIDDIAEWNGASWDFNTPAIGWATFVIDEDKTYVFTSSGWADMAGQAATLWEVNAAHINPIDNARDVVFGDDASATAPFLFDVSLERLNLHPDTSTAGPYLYMDVDVPGYGVRYYQFLTNTSISSKYALDFHRRVTATDGGSYAHSGRMFSLTCDDVETSGTVTNSTIMAYISNQTDTGKTLYIDHASTGDVMNLTATANSSVFLCQQNITNKLVNKNNFDMARNTVVNDGGTYTSSGNILRLANSPTETSGTITDSTVIIQTTQSGDTGDTIKVGTHASTGDVFDATSIVGACNLETLGWYWANKNAYNKTGLRIELNGVVNDAGSYTHSGDMIYLYNHQTQTDGTITNSMDMIHTRQDGDSGYSLNLDHNINSTTLWIDSEATSATGIDADFQNTSGNLIDVSVNNVSKFKLTYDGKLSLGSAAGTADGTLHLDNGASDTDLIIEKDAGTAADIIFHNAGAAGAHIAFDSNEDIVIENDTADKDIRFKVLYGAVDTEIARMVGSTGYTGFAGSISAFDLTPSGSAAFSYLDNTYTQIGTGATGWAGLNTSVIRTAGTDGASPLIGGRTDVALNQNGATVTALQGHVGSTKIDDGTATSMFGMYSLKDVNGGTVGNLYGIYNVLDLDGGTISNNAYGSYIKTDQEAGNTISGNIYNIFSEMDMDGTVTGTSYNTYIKSATGVDYGIYEDGGATQNILLSNTSIGSAAGTVDGVLHLDNGASDTDLVIEKDAATQARIVFHNAGSEEASISYDASEDMTFTTAAAANSFNFIGGNVSIGLVPTTNMVGLSIEAGVVTIKETTTPTADTDYGKVYTKNDNKLYFQDGAGVEHEIAFV